MNLGIEPRRVLYVEDDDMDLLFMQRTFAAEGWGDWLYYARDGPEAMAWLEGQGKHGDRSRYPVPDLVLLDILLPGANGLEVLRWIRDQPRLVSMPVILFSGSDLESDVANAYRLGVNLYLNKPACDGLGAVARFIVGWLQLSPSPSPFKKEWWCGDALIPAMHLRPAA